MGHLLMKNHSGLLVDAMLTTATATAERAAAEAMLAGQTGRHRATVGADKGYDAADFAAVVRALNVTPHVAQNTSRRSAIDGRTTRHPGYALSQRMRKRIEEALGWNKTTGGFRIPGTGAPPGSAGCSPSPPRSATWSGCRSCSRRPDHARSPLSDAASQPDGRARGRPDTYPKITATSRSRAPISPHFRTLLVQRRVQKIQPRFPGADAPT